MNARQSIEQSLQEYETEMRILEMRRSALGMQIEDVDARLAKARGGYEALHGVLQRIDSPLSSLFETLPTEAEAERIPAGDPDADQPVAWDDPRVPDPVDADDDDPALAIANP